MRTTPWILCGLLFTPALASQGLPLSKSLLRAEYQARSKRLAPADVVGHFALAQWCAAKGLPRCARWEIHEVLRESRDHIGARKMLGQVRHQGRWIEESAWMQRRGFVRHDGQWMSKEAAARRRHAHAVQREANSLFAKLAESRAVTRRGALRDLVGLAQRERLPEIAGLARRKFADYDRYWNTRAAAVHIGLLEVRATHSELLKMDSFTTSLGVGNPVTIQLPQMRTVSIGTTVGIPLGIGR